MTPEQHASEITKGLWLYPHRKRNIEREIIEHLEDAAEEHNIEDWTEDQMIKHFGSKKNLRKLFTNNGLPLWARCLKWGLRGIAGIIAILFLLNLYLLFFYSLDPSIIRIYHANQAFFNQFQPHANLNIYKNTTWLDPNDEIAVQTWELFQQCIQARDEFWNAEGKAREEFKDLPEIANKIQNATRPEQHFNPAMGMGMGARIDTILNKEELKKMDEYIHEQVKDEILALIDLWVQITPESRFHFKRPEVTQEDIDLYNQYAPHTNNLHQDSPHTFQRYPWLGVAVNNQFHQSRMPVEEIIQYAKDLTFRQPYSLAIQDILGRIRDHGKDLPAEKAKQTANASSIWIRKYMESVNPNFELLIDVLYSVAYTGTLRHMITDQVNTLHDLSMHSETLQALIDIPIAPMVKDYPNFDEFEQYEHSVFNSIMMGLGQFSIFRVQFGVMQWFYRPNSDGYHHYELMKRGIYLLFMNMGMINFKNAQERINTVLAWQENAKALLALEKHLQANKPPDSFSPLQAGIVDPFQDEGLKFEVDADTITLSSTGNNDVFDPGIIYEPSNGIRSKGDLIWTLKRDE